MSSATRSPKWPRSPGVRRRLAANWPPQPAAAYARRRLPTTPTAQQARIVKDFKQAWEAHDIDTLIGLLDPDATAIADGGGLASAALHPIEGAEQIARHYVDIAGRTPANVTILERTVNGQPGLVAQQDGVTVTVFAFDLAGDRIKHIWAVRNPDKLRPWTRG
jgi:SnoaL-like domain